MCYHCNMCATRWWASKRAVLGFCARHQNDMNISASFVSGVEIVGPMTYDEYVAWSVLAS